MSPAPVQLSWKDRGYFMGSENNVMRRILFGLIFTVIFMGLVPHLWAQTTGYLVERRLVQRLAWAADAYTRQYEVTVEIEEGGRYRQLLKEMTTQPFIEVSLSPGNYRFRVIPYDYLDHPGNASAWMNFEVRPILAPELHTFSPSQFYLAENATHELTITGRNIAPDAGIFLRRSGGALVTPVETQISRDGTSARIVIRNDQVTQGDYEVMVRNPGAAEIYKTGIVFALSGQETVSDVDMAEQIKQQAEQLRQQAAQIEQQAEQLKQKTTQVEQHAAQLEQQAAQIEQQAAQLEQQEEQFEQQGEQLEQQEEQGDEIPEPHIEYKRPAAYVSAAWIPLLPLYADDNRAFGGSNSFAGAGVRAGMFFPGDFFLNPGLELTAFWQSCENNFNDMAQPGAFGINLLTQKRFPSGRAAFNFRLGAGLFLFRDNDTGNISEGSYYSYMNIGLSFFWLIVKDLYLEAGLDYAHVLSEQRGGCFRPWLGIGWKF